MVDITINNFECRIIGELDSKILRRLDNILSYEIPGAMFMPSSSHWDGKVRLMDRHLRFQYGLLNKVTSFFNNNEIAVNIIDNRIKQPSCKIDISSALARMKKTPRDYQTKAADLVFDNDCGIIRAATGSGKSLIAAMMIANLGKRSILFVTGLGLLYQMCDFLKDIFGKDNIGIVGDGICDIKKITVASVWTAGCAVGLKKGKIVEDHDDDEKEMDADKYKDIRQMISDAKVLIYDECHGCAAQTFVEIAKYIKPDNIYGMSASPWRDDNADLLIEALLGKRIIDISASTLIDEGHLVRPTIKFIDVPKYPEKLQKNYPLVYKKYIIENEVRNNIILDGTLKLIELGYKPLVLFDKLAHGKILYDLISEKVPCGLLSGKDSANARLKTQEELVSGKIKCLIASRILDQGIDIPELSALVCAGGGKSSTRALQRIGRVLRPHASKKNAAVIEFLDNTHYLKDHSKRRRKIYESEKGFVVKWPSS